MREPIGASKGSPAQPSGGMCMPFHQFDDVRFLARVYCLGCCTGVNSMAASKIIVIIIIIRLG